MKFLSDKTGWNIHDNGTIEITSNSIFDDDNDYHPKHLANYGSNDYYKSKGDKLSNICFDFKDIKILLNGYSIKSGSNGSNSYHLRIWVIEVSNDAKKWEIVDSHLNELSLKNLLHIKLKRKIIIFIGTFKYVKQMWAWTIVLNLTFVSLNFMEKWNAKMKK